MTNRYFLASKELNRTDTLLVNPTTAAPTVGCLHPLTSFELESRGVTKTKSFHGNIVFRSPSDHMQRTRFILEAKWKIERRKGGEFVERY